MTEFGNHTKIIVGPGLRKKTRAFYVEILGCKLAASPAPHIDIFAYANGAFVGVFYMKDHLTAAQVKRGAWLEIKHPRPAALKKRILEFGLKAVESDDPRYFYFQAPGGQVYRLAATTPGAR